MLPLFKEIKKHIYQVLIVLVIFVVVVLQIENSTFFKELPFTLQNYFSVFGSFSAVFYVTIYVIITIFLIPSFPFLFASGIIFGWNAIFIMIIGSVVSSSVNFLLGKKLNRALFSHGSHHEKLALTEKYIRKHGFSVVLLLRYLGFYYGIVSYAGGMSGVKYRDFIIASTIGYIPYIFIFAYAGIQLLDVQSSSFVYTILLLKLALFGTFGIGYLIYKKRKTTHPS